MSDASTPPTYDHKAHYMAEIKPLVDKIGDLCQAAEIPHLMAFGIVESDKDAEVAAAIYTDSKKHGMHAAVLSTAYDILTGADVTKTVVRVLKIDAMRSNFREEDQG